MAAMKQLEDGHLVDQALAIAKHAARADADSIALFHVRADDTVGDPLLRLDKPAGAGKGKPEPWQAHATTIYQAARAEATALGAVQRYGVYCYSGDRPGNRLVFRVAPDPTLGPAAGGELTSEPPGARGLLPQAYRHIEALMRQGALTTATLVQMLCGQLERSEARAEKAYAMVDRMGGKHIDMLEAVEQLMDRSGERLVAQREEDFKIAAKTRLLEAVSPVVTDVVTTMAKWVQRRVMTPSAADTGVADWDALTLEQQVFSLVQGIKEPELEAIVEALSEQSRAKLLKIWSRLQDAPPDMKTRKPGKTNGAAPAPGKTPTT